MRRIDYAANRERINVQKRAAYAARKGYTNQAASAILDTSNKIGVNQDVNFVCKIDRSLYRIVEQDLVTDEVISQSSKSFILRRTTLVIITA